MSSCAYRVYWERLSVVIDTKYRASRAGWARDFRAYIGGGAVQYGAVGFSINYKTIDKNKKNIQKIFKSVIYLSYRRSHARVRLYGLHSKVWAGRPGCRPRCR